MATYPFDLSITNPGAEAGAITGWTQDKETGFTVASSLSGTEMTVTTPYAGTYSFYHGGTAQSVVHQDVDLSGIDAAYLSDIDAGYVTLNISAAIITDKDGSDQGSYSVHFYDGSSVWLGGTKHDTDNGASWHTFQHTGIPVPEGTRVVRLELRAYRNGGDSGNNVYWDSITAKLQKRANGSKAKHIGAFKPTATTGWTNVTGTLTYTASVSALGSGGSDWGFDPALRWGNNATGHAYNAMSFPSGWNTDIDAGNVTLVTRYRHTDDPSGGATGRTYVEFYNSSNVIIGSRLYSDASEVQIVRFDTGGWKHLSYAVPANARSIRFGHMGTKSALTTLFHHLQYATVLLVYTPPSSNSQTVATTVIC